jgi:hypothetical protein
MSKALGGTKDGISQGPKAMMGAEQGLEQRALFKRNSAPRNTSEKGQQTAEW